MVQHTAARNNRKWRSILATSSDEIVFSGQSPARPWVLFVSGQPDIFEYLDYREFLQAYYDWAKATQSGFSYRRFSRDAGYSAPNVLKLVIKGERNLTPTSTKRFARAMRLRREEREFFEELVAFDQARTPEEANEAYARIASSKRFRSARRIDNHLFEYLSHWYYPAIRELAGREGFCDDPAWIAEQLLPSISEAEARQALEVLFELGLLVRDASGRVDRGEPSLTTGHGVKALAVGNYHRQMLQQAMRSISDVSGAWRDISALTVCIDDPIIGEIKRRIRAFREELLDLCDSRATPRHVYQLNVQFFPLSNPERAAAEPGARAADDDPEEAAE